MNKSIFICLLVALMSGSVFAQHTTYQVQENETLEAVAKKFNVSKDAILKLNPGVWEKNLANQTLVIPAQEVGSGTKSASAVHFKEYHVKAKETLYSLAKRNNITVEDIKKYNPYLYEEELGENDMIKIPIYENEMKDFNTSLQSSTFENLIHVVMPKETKYGISKKYGMSIEELEQMNPMIQELQPGQILRVRNPSAVAKERESEFSYYKVEPKETLYSLTKRFNISQDSLERLNPILKELGLQAGMELKLPNGTGAVEIDDSFGNQKIDLVSKISRDTTQKIAVMLPLNLNSVGGEESAESVLKSDSYMQVSLDLYSGIKMALDSVQKMGIAVDAEVFDTQKSTAHVRQLMAQSNLDRFNVIIGPLLPSNIEEVASGLKHSKTAVFSPLTSSNIKGSDQIFQSRPTSQIKEQVLINYLKQHQNGKNIAILGNQKNTALVGKIKSALPSAVSITQSNPDFLQKSDLTRVLSKDRPNWVIIESDDVGAVNNTISNLNAMRGDYDIQLFTSDKTQIEKAEVESIYLSHLKLTYTSIDKEDTDQSKDIFIQKYIQRYGITPSSYAIRGFDLTMDAVLRSAVSSDLFQTTEKMKGYTEYVGNRFSYHAKSANGYYNSGVYLLQFDENLALKVLN